jgi:hypothetical protein
VVAVAAVAAVVVAAAAAAVGDSGIDRRRTRWHGRWAPDARQTDAGGRRQQQSGEQGGGNAPTDQVDGSVISLGVGGCR